MFHDMPHGGDGPASGDDPRRTTAPDVRTPIDPLGDEIAHLCAHIDASQYRLLTLLQRFDAAEGWSGWISCAHWLSWRTGMTTGTARERVRVARRLAVLPLASTEMEKGRLSWSKVRALTRIATDENEERLVEFALHHTASQVERFVRAWRSAEAAADAWDDHSQVATRRYLNVQVLEDGMYRVRGWLTPELGALLMQALEAAGDELYRAERATERKAEQEAEREAERRDREPPAPWEPRPLRLPRTPGQRHHDALQAWLEDTTSANVQLVVHTVAGAPDIVSTEECSHVPAGTSRRLSCDAEAVRVTRGLDGSVLDVGRRRRTVNWRLRKALEVRDGGCRFPGCGSRYTQAHHAIPWAEGGDTALDNLILLCRFHHRMVHEGGWRVEMKPRESGAGGAAHFRDPDGTAVPAVAPLREDVEAPATPDAGLADWHRQKGIDPWTGAGLWEGDRLDMDWALWVLWGQYGDARAA
ncbi:DUF222 domain-containing protein [Candidatus Palauibacter sp.]|uniref:HNH endonuclease signature motif containing protein n=1 Tax=Candidatus Palauibacter sp. TaxID=3101350 RepID=UPI003B51DA5D